MFAVMKAKGMVEIPKGCILQRWTIRAKLHLSNPHGYLSLHNTNDETAATGRFAFLNGMSKQLCRMVSTSYEQFMWLKDKLVKMLMHTKKEKVTLNIDELEGKGNMCKKKGKGKCKGQGSRKRMVEEVERDYDPFEDLGMRFDPLEEMFADDPNYKQGIANFGDGFSFVNLMKQFMPKTYCEGDASNAKDRYEVITFSKMPIVFD
ncbi:hypothetical protein BVRB_9g206970 [Beta vulgaris subsp. vulgaris]|uniref:Uncharacterized protein n=1 Tax=Beta vulgaris subsp. vulgaris TaxID=3555 RepID=A0A0J8BLA5_BETVV|nr:hypothetical protein BVRB_9g206970 [Beta vulgaris subsp. vulgaris]